MNSLIMALATGLWVGKIRKAPGTWGSLIAFLPWLLMKDLALPAYLCWLLFIFILGCLVAGAAEKLLDASDPGCIVIDEILGMLISLMAVPQTPAALLLSFLLFRLFDIFKPFPVSSLDKHIHGGLGIMLDDVMAGLYTFLVLLLIF